VPSKSLSQKKHAVTSRTCCSTERVLPVARPPTKVRYRMMSLVVSVFPAPLSPLTNMDWLRFSPTTALEEREKKMLIDSPYYKKPQAGFS
jgi:hypothetical protein